MKFYHFLTSVIIVLLLSSSYSFSQEKKSLETTSDSWQKYTSIQGVDIYVKKIDYSPDTKELPSRYLIFKITNNNSQAITIGYNSVLYSNQYCLNCDSKECYSEISLQPGESVEGDPSKVCSVLATLVFNGNLKSVYTTTHFSIKNLIIK